jgi:hypothetical protein
MCLQRVRHLKVREIHRLAIYLGRNKLYCRDQLLTQINSIKDLNTHCLAEFRKHWECLDDRNHQLWQCRPAEWKLNKCVFDNLVRSSRSLTSSGASNMMYRNLRRRCLISLPTTPPFTSDQSRSLPTCALALVMVSPLFRGRRMRSNKVLEYVEVDVRSCIFVDESKKSGLPTIKSKYFSCIRHHYTIAALG